MRFGVFLMIIGFGSSILHFTGYQFRLVGWAEEWQPGLGIAIGGVGILVAVLFSMLRGRQSRGTGGQLSPAYAQQPYPAHPGPQQHVGWPAPGQPPVAQQQMAQQQMAQQQMAPQPMAPQQMAPQQMAPQHMVAQPMAQPAYPQQSTPYGGQPLPKFPPRPADSLAPQFGPQSGDFRPQDR